MKWSELKKAVDSVLEEEGKANETNVDPEVNSIALYSDIKYGELIIR